MIGSGLRGVAKRHRPGLHLDIDLGVDVGGIEAGMTEPGADRVEIDAGLEQMAGAGVPSIS